MARSKSCKGYSQCSAKEIRAIAWLRQRGLFPVGPASKNIDLAELKRHYEAREEKRLDELIFGKSNERE